MQDIVFLGIFDKIAQWVMSGIAKAITWLVSNIILPIFSILWDNVLKYVFDFITEIVGLLLYKIFAILLTLLYGIEKAVYAFGGAIDVQYGDKKGNFLSMIFGFQGVSDAFMYINIIGITLCFLFTIYSVTKSTFDFSYDGKKSVGVILTQFFTSAITFLIIPIFCYGLMQLTSICTRSLYMATSASQSVSITDTLYMLTAGCKLNTSEYNQLANLINSQPMVWFDWSNVSGIIGKTTNVDYLFGYVGALAIIWNLIMLSSVFIQRALEVTVLYIVSPFFVATMPLDDGERFRKWRKTFIGRLCMGIFMIVALNIVMMILSILVSGAGGNAISFTPNVKITDNTVQAVTNKSIDILLKLVFIIGSLMSVKTVGNMITAIIDSDAAGAESSAFNRPYETVKNAANYAYRFKRHMKRKEKRDKEKEEKDLKEQSKERGFKGETATKADLAFDKKLSEHRNKLENKEKFTKMGAKSVALTKASKKTKDLQNKLRNATTAQEREAIRKEFEKEGGFKGISVDTKKYAKSDSSSKKERNAIENLNNNIKKAKAQRDLYDKGSKEWNKHNDQINSLKMAREKLMSANSHNERENIISGNKDAFEKSAKMNKKERKAASLLAKKTKQAKDRRDSFEQGTKEWSDADAVYNEIRNKHQQLLSSSDHESRNELIENTGEANNEKAQTDGNLAMTEKEQKFADKLEKSKETARKKYLNQAPGRTKQAYKKEVQNMQATIDAFKAQTSREARAEFQKAFESAGMADILEAKKDKSDERVSFTESKMLANLKDKKSEAVKNRDMFEKDSENWNYFDQQVQRYNKIDEALQGEGTKAKRAEIMKENSDAFEGKEKRSPKQVFAEKRLDANIQTAKESRDRYKEGSAKWKQADAKVQGLVRTKAEFGSQSTVGQKDTFIKENANAFKDTSNDKNYTKIESGYTYWTDREKLALNADEREHAHKMAKTYADFSQSYMFSSDDEKVEIMQQVDDFETNANMTELAFTPKETAFMNSLNGESEKDFVDKYAKAKTHTERREIRNSVIANRTAQAEREAQQASQSETSDGETSQSGTSDGGRGQGRAAKRREPTRKAQNVRGKNGGANGKSGKTRKNTYQRTQHNQRNNNRNSKKGGGRK